MSLYDLVGMHNSIRKMKQDRLRKEYIDKNFKSDDESSLYNLNYIGRMTLVYNEAEKKFS